MMRWIAGVALAAACAGRPQEYRGPVNVQSSALMPFDPDVKVVADSDKPMFHVASAYWLFHDAGWYRAASVRGPWIGVRNPPWQVRKIDQPYAFTRYRLQHPNERVVASEQPAQAQPAPRAPGPAREHGSDGKPIVTLSR